MLMLMATAPAKGQTAVTCQEQFSTLLANTESVSITGGKIDKERAGLKKLVNDAKDLALNGKSSDAVKKLNDFTVKVDQLEAADRISPEDAIGLRSDAQATISCLQGSDATTAEGATSS